MSTMTIRPGLDRTRSAQSVRPAPAAAAARVRTRAPQAAQRGGSVRLTRRGRVVVLALVLLVVLALMTILGPGSAASGEAGTPVETRTVEVGSGDTLWGIAAQVAEPGETRDMVHRIQQLNALTGSGVTVGQEIAVPVG